MNQSQAGHSNVIREARAAARAAGVPLYSRDGVAIAMTIIEQETWSRTTHTRVVLDPARATDPAV